MTDFFAAIVDTIGRDGFAFVRAPEMHAALEAAGRRDWASFAASWDDLGIDTYMADGGRYRRRRFAAFRASSAEIVRKKVADVVNSGAGTLLAGDLGCLLNMAGKLGRRGAKVKARHVAEVLAGMADGPAIGEGST